MTQHPKQVSLALLGVFMTMISTSCQAGGGGGAGDPMALAMDTIEEPPTNLPWNDQAASDDPNHLTLALKYVSYVKDDGQPVMAQDTAKAVLDGINQIFKTCNLHFRGEQYLAAKPSETGLKYSPSAMNELPQIRKVFDDESQIVVINTGPWDSSGGLGADGANAWTMMPGNSPSGAVIEGPVAATSNLVAHEIGHYLNLDHASDTSNLMNPVIYSTSLELTPSQCEQVRQAALTARSGSLRKKAS